MRKYLLHNKLLLSLIIVLKLVFAAFNVGLAMVLQILTNLITAQGTTVNDLVMAIVYCFVYLIVLGGVMFLTEWLSLRYSNNAVNKLRIDYSNKLLSLNYDEFSKVDSAQYISNLTNDMKLLADNYFNTWLNVIDSIFMFVFAVALAFYIHPVVAATMLGLVLLVFLVPLIFNKPMNKANLEFSETMKDYTQMIKQTFLGINVIKNFDAVNIYSEKIEEHSDRLKVKKTRLDVVGNFAGNMGMLVVALLQFGSIFVAGYYVLIGSLTIGSVIAVVQLGGQLFGPITNVANKATVIKGIKGLSKLLTDTLNTEIVVGEDIDVFENSLQLNNVTFSYADSETPALDDVSIAFDKGKKYLIVGQSGSGKSTILKLISKMYCNYDGDILIDNKDLKNISNSGIAKISSFASQSGYVFSTTIKENIDFMARNDRELLLTATELANLNEFVDKFPETFDAIIDEEVNQISGGEKTRIALARALCKDFDILLMDEVTSALDKESSFIVESNMLNLKDKTVVNVSHKINSSLIDSYDKIAIMEKGKLLEFGNVNEIKTSKYFARYITETN